MHTKIRTFLIFSFILGFMLGACSAPPSPSGEVASSVFSPLQMDLVLEKLPKLGEEVLITATIYTIMAVSDASAEIQLPEGAKLIDGDLVWQGDLMEDTSVQIQARIAFTEEGNWIIHALTQKRFDENNSIGEEKTIYLHVSAEGSEYGFDDGCPDPLVAVYPAVNLEDGSQGEVRCEPPEPILEVPPPPEPTPLSWSDSTSN
jgi:hypothetical protein